MGRFKISDMIPNAWFYKIKDMSTSTSSKAKNKTKKKQQPITTTSSSSSFFSSSISSSSTSSTLSSAAPPQHPTKLPHHLDQPPAHQRKSYYFTRDLTEPITPPQPPKAHLPDPPRKSSKKRRPATNKRSAHRKSFPGLLITNSTLAAGCSCRNSLESVWTQPDSCTDTTSSENESLLPDISESGHGSFTSAVSSLSCPCRRSSSSDDKFDNVDLPPIITKPENIKKHGSGKWVIEERSQYSSSLSIKVVKDEDIMGISTKEQKSQNPVRKSPAKFKTNNYSPRVGNRVRVQAINGGRRSTGNRRSLSESFAVVKTSVDPQRDFKESMVEMIMENNIKSSKDLEELLACYLSLNSDEYHDLIIKVFRQIWLECSDTRFCK